MKRNSFAALALALLVGCTTTEELAAHRYTVEAWERVEIARANANARRFDALVEVSRHGNETAQVAVAFATMGGGNGGGFVQSTSPPTPPESADARALRWASIIVPTATALASGYFGYKLGVSQSNNSARIAETSYGVIGRLGEAAVGASRDVAHDGFQAAIDRPAGTFVTISGSGNATSLGGAATLDNSRRCAPMFALNGAAAPSGGLTVTGGAGATTGTTGAGGGSSFTLPFNC